MTPFVSYTPTSSHADFYSESENHLSAASAALVGSAYDTMASSEKTVEKVQRKAFGVITPNTVTTSFLREEKIPYYSFGVPTFSPQDLGESVS